MNLDEDKIDCWTCRMMVRLWLGELTNERIDRQTDS